MKYILLILLTCFIKIISIAQEWPHTIGVPGLNEESHRVIEHYDQGYIITGLYSGGYNDIHGLIIKTDINGNVLWDKGIGVSPDIVLLVKTLYDSVGNMYIFGTINPNQESHWPVMIKLNACGELVFCRYFEFPGIENGYFTDAILLENGDLLGLASMPDANQYDKVYLLRITPEGEYLWKKSYASKANHPTFKNRLGSRIQFFEDIYIISGLVYSTHPSNPSIASLRPMFIGIDTLFNEQWVLEFGLEDNMKGKALSSIPINDSLFMGVGRYRYVDTIGDTQDAWAMYYNDKGEQTGYSRITRDKLGYEVNESVFYEVERINDSMYISTAGFYSIEYDEYRNGEIVFDTLGNVYDYAIRVGSSASTYLSKTFDEKYVVATSKYYSNFTWDIYFYKINENLAVDTTYPGAYSYDSLCPDLPIQSGIIDLAGCGVITQMEYIPWFEDYNQHISVTAYPNPTNEEFITFQFSNTENYSEMELKCFNVFGEQMHNEKVYPNQGESKVDICNWQKGIYLAIVYSAGKQVGSTKFIVR